MKAIHIAIVDARSGARGRGASGSSRFQPDYPTRTVKLIVPYPPGCGTDLVPGPTSELDRDSAVDLLARQQACHRCGKQ